jgi:membrane peptidoglycan carboxypeptidase
VDAGDATEALEEIKNYNFQLDQNQMEYPHWVNYIRMLLESQFDAQTIYRSGFTVYTTLDPVLQDMAETIVEQQVKNLSDRNVTGGALIAIRPTTGEILSMVGSPDFYNEVNSGQVNMAINPRQPGSAIKPLTYTAAFEKGWTPSTLIWDVQTDFPPSGDPNDPRPPYQPVNYDERFHGPVTVREALANSYNIPAVKALDFVGIYDDPKTSEADGLISMAQRLGITTLTRPDYGLSLTLGGGEVTLLELTNAYSTFANNGRYINPVAILKIVDHEGNLIYEYAPPSGNQIIRQEHAYLINSILSDNAARTPMFGANSVLNLPFTAAAKTGTTNDYRDNWTVGYTPDLAVGVWIGNPNYTPMLNTTGLSGAAPIWSTFMQQAIPQLTGGYVTPFVRPAGIVDEIVCEYSGTLPSEWCPSQTREIFAYDQPPLPKSDDLWVKVDIDTWTGLKTSPQCNEYTEEKFALNVEDPWAKRWIIETSQGQEWAKSLGFEEPVFFVPKRECAVNDPRPRILFAGIEEEQTIMSNPLDIYALITASENFRDYRLEYGLGGDPVEWKVLIDRVSEQHDPPDRIYTWDLSDVPAGVITLRLYVRSTKNTFAERRLHLDIQVPTQTPTITVTPTMTPTITVTPTITQTPTMTDVPPTTTPTFTPTPTATPTNTPTQTLTPTTTGS